MDIYEALYTTRAEGIGFTMARVSCYLIHHSFGFVEMSTHPGCY
jgi:hypothetical protein